MTSTAPEKAAYISSLAAAIRMKHGCEPTWLGTVPVRFRDGETTWKCEVEVFAINGHNQAKQVYAWAADDQAAFCAIVLEVPPVVSPETALRAAVQKGLV